MQVGQAPAGRRKRAAIVVAVLLLGSCARESPIRAARESPTSRAQRYGLTGSVTRTYALASTNDKGAADNGGCIDLERVKVSIRDGSDKQIATAATSTARSGDASGTDTGRSCTVTFAAEIPRSLLYKFFVGETPGPTYTFEQLRTRDFGVEMTLSTDKAVDDVLAPSQDRATQSALRNAVTAAKVIYTENEDFADATSAALADVEPALTFVDEDTESTEAMTVSVFGGTSRSTVFHAAAWSAAGTCWYIRDEVGESSTAGTHWKKRENAEWSDCTAAAAADTTDVWTGKSPSTATEAG
jgi:hypothetical protein